MSDESNAGDKLLFLLLGAAIGAVSALLFAPRSGEETRKMMKMMSSGKKMRIPKM